MIIRLILLILLTQRLSIITIDAFMPYEGSDDEYKIEKGNGIDGIMPGIDGSFTLFGSNQTSAPTFPDGISSILSNTTAPTKYPTNYPTKYPTNYPTSSPTIYCPTGYYIHGSERNCSELKIGAGGSLPITYLGSNKDFVCTTLYKAVDGDDTQTTRRGNGKKDNCLAQGKEVSYADADVICNSSGMRLCSEQEILDGAGYTLPHQCWNSNDDLFWTDTPCSDDRGFRKVQKLNPNQAQSTDICLNEQSSTVGGKNIPVRVICCADKVTNQNLLMRPCLKCPDGYTTRPITVNHPVKNIGSCYPILKPNTPTFSPTMQPTKSLLIRKPNVLLILVDDLRLDIETTKGDVPLKIPVIDKLKNIGVNFKAAYAQQALCGPSRASLITSMRPDSIGITDLLTDLRERQGDKVITLPQIFKQSGYNDVVGFGKIFDGRNTASIQDFPLSWTRKPWNMFGEEDRYVPRARDGKIDVDGCGYGDGESSSNPMTQCVFTENLDLFPDGQLVSQVVQLLTDQTSTKKITEPWFLAVGFGKPHLPWSAPGKYWQMYNITAFTAQVDRDMSESRGPIGRFKGSLHANNEIATFGGFPSQLGDGRLNPAKSVRLRVYHGYYASISFIDSQIGRIIDALKSRPNKEYDNTLIILTSDHGFHLGDKSVFGKWTVYEQATKVPLLIVPPKNSQAVPGLDAYRAFEQSRGKSTYVPVEMVDLLPTIADLAEIRNYNTYNLMDGRSLVSILKDPLNSKGVRLVSVSQYPFFDLDAIVPGSMSYSLRSKRYRFIVHCMGLAGSCNIQAKELYDMYFEPRELRNLIDDPDYKTITTKFMELWRYAASNRWLKIPVPDKNDDL